MISQPKVVVSLTSFPAAIPYAVRAVQSILQGSVKPDKLILYLTFSQFPEGEIPSSLREIESSNPIFEIRNYDKDIRSYRKLVPALLDFPEDTIIVTVDDDVNYHRHLLRDLLRLHKQYPKAILAHRAKRIEVDKPYRKWKKYRWYHFLLTKYHLGYENLATGVGGVLYPPHALKKDMIDEGLFTQIAPTTDDIWFWAAAVANGTKIMPVPFGYNKPRGLDKPRNLSLKTTNFKSKVDLNHTALMRIIEKYPIVGKRIK
ncbi:glycosyltransferase [Bacteroidales bacterium OttesenSCG-928-M11]|nr:glycosyltransferase [Bacteroidales bacterium OttesenSCG-928-M11]